MSNYQTTEQQHPRWQNRNADGGHIWTGIFLLIVGGAALAKSLSLPIPAWLFSWESFLITLGLFIGVRGNFHGAAWFLLILIGAAFLLNDIYPSIELRRHFFPLIIIILGALFIVRPKGAKRHQHRMRSRENDFIPSADNLADVTTIFGTSKKKMNSKQFSGGDITCLFGSTEIDLSDAEISGQVVLDITTICGGVELIIPAHWIVKSEITSVFGSVKDRREQTSSTYTDSETMIVLDGTAMFGGIEIKSFSGK